MGKYQHYAIETSEGKRIFGSWEECQEFRDRHPKTQDTKALQINGRRRSFLVFP